MIKYICILLFLIISAHCQISNGQQRPSSEILQGIKKLNVTGSVLYIAAHPDDENTRLLTWLSKEKNLRTAYLSLTRGDGGQNLVGKEQGDLLGLLRTQELLAARKIDGAEQFFTRANDFGYSKNPEETFRIWNKDSILSDVVFTIRRFRPDVIICRFPSTGEGGHGHHTASAILASEAFDAAADPKRFSWQLAYVKTWKTTRMLWNTFNFGGNNTTSSDQLQVDVGGFNPLSGKSYGEYAAESRSNHKSQGFGSAKTRGSNIEYFKFLKGDSSSTDLFKSIDQSWNRVANASIIRQSIDECVNTYQLEKPEKSIPALIKIYKHLQSLAENDAEAAYWKKQKTKETLNLIQACAALWIEAPSAEYTVIPGNQIEFSVQAVMRNDLSIKLNKIIWPGKTDSILSQQMKQNELYTFKHKEILSSSTAFSNPYWLNLPHDAGLYVVNDRQKIGSPENEDALQVYIEMEINGEIFRIERPLVFKSADPVKGEVYRPLEILPPATVNISSGVFIFPDLKPGKVQFTIHSNINKLSGKLLLDVPEGWQISQKEVGFNLDKKGDETSIELSLTPLKTVSRGKIHASLLIDGKSYSKSIRRIEYDHVPYQFTLTESEAVIESFDLKKGGKRIGYIPGAGDEVASSLKQAGYDVDILTEELLTAADLSVYDAIVSGIRAYNTNERLPSHYSKLMSYVQQGGNLIVQYNTNSRIGPLNSKIGPYAFTISRDRVTNENAEVRILKPDHPAMNHPNLIGKEDFSGWIQERGIYFAKDQDKEFENILSMNDPDEKANEGSLIVAPYGKGNFVYTGLVFFRELPAGVPGAYRLLANLLALPPHK
jgi:LmbE family N-acetylglucosaminyl deacetylase